MRRPAAARPAALLILLSAAAAHAQEAGGADAGQLLFNNICRTCHTLEENDNRLGPHLHDIVGRKAGSLPGYAYSAAMAGSGIVWDDANLDRFIADPEEIGRASCRERV